MSSNYDSEEANSPSASIRYRRSKRRKKSKSKFNISERDAINIETKTLTKKINIKWTINKQTIEIAKLSSKGEKKGVIETSVKYNNHTFNLELCVPGWRRSQDGFSAFYLTVPRKKIKRKAAKSSSSMPTTMSSSDEDEEDRNNNANQANHNHDRSNVHIQDNNNHDDTESVAYDEDAEEANNDNNNDFVARYTVTFGHTDNKLTRKSSIRNDFDLGVGFPNFTEISTLSDGIYRNKLVFDIEVEVFECESVVKDRGFPFMDSNQANGESITSKLLSKMYDEKLNCDAVIVAHFKNQQNMTRTKQIKVHKCILTAASPVFSTFFKHKSKENVTSSIIMNQWNYITILTMIKFLYLGKIELNHEEESNLMDDDDGSDGEQRDDLESVQGLDEDEEDEEEDETSLDLDEAGLDDPVNIDLSEEVKCGEEEEQNKAKNVELDNLENECPENARRLFALFQIAECYEINELSIACCHKLASYITYETSCIFLMYLDRYTHLDEKMREIKHYILDFIVNNIHSVKRTNGYLYLLQNKPDLLDELIVKITENTRN